MVVDTGGVLTISKSQDETTTIGMEGISLASREAAVLRMPTVVKKQDAIAVEESSVIIFLVDDEDIVIGAFYFIWFVKNAKNANFAAIEEGIVPGGGAALLYLSTFVPAIKEKIVDPEEQLGADIIQKALVAPAALIAQNAGVEGEVVVEKIKASEWEFGYNAMTDTYENLVEAGVIDPAKVTRCALQNAASVTGMVLTTQAIVVEKPKLKTAAAASLPGTGSYSV